MGLNATPVTGPVWPVIFCNCLPSAVLRILIVASLPATASSLLSELRASALTVSPKTKSRKGDVLGTSQILAVLSEEPEARL